MRRSGRHDRSWRTAYAASCVSCLCRALRAVLVPAPDCRTLALPRQRPHSVAPSFHYDRPLDCLLVVTRSTRREHGAGGGAAEAASAADGRPAGVMVAAVPLHGQPVRPHAFRACGGGLLRKRCAHRGGHAHIGAKRRRAASVARGSAPPRHAAAAQTARLRAWSSRAAGTAVGPKTDSRSGRLAAPAAPADALRPSRQAHSGPYPRSFSVSPSSASAAVGRFAAARLRPGSRFLLHSAALRDGPGAVRGCGLLRACVACLTRVASRAAQATS